MRLVFVNRFFYPDEAATALMLGDLVFKLEPAWPERHVITSRSSYAANGKRLPSRETVQGVHIHRVPSLAVGNASLAARLLNFASFYALSFVATLRLARRGDVIVCLTDPPLGSVVIGAAARLKGAHLVNWLQDIYPEVATQLGYARDNSLLVDLAERLRGSSWKRARANVVIGQVMADHVARRGIRRSQIQVIPNWADETALAPLPAEQNPLRKAWGLKPHHCVVGYSGNLGRAHDVDTMLTAIATLGSERRSRIRFLFIGGGAKLDRLKELARAGTAANVSLQPYQPREALRESLSVPDVHWLSLEPGLEGLIVPSKFYGAAAIGRPIVFIGSKAGEIARLIEQGECGKTFEPGDHVGLIRYLRELDADPALRVTLGTKARAFSESHLRREDRIAEWARLLEGIKSGDAR